MESWMDQASELNDRPSGINNYAEASLHLASTYRNRSKQFNSKLTLHHPIVTKFLSKHQNEKNESQLKQQKQEVQKFADFLENTKDSKTKSREITNEQENKKACLVPKYESEPNFASSPQIRSSGLNFERQNVKFEKENLPDPEAQFPIRPTFQNSNIRSSNPGPDKKKFHANLFKASCY